MKNQTCLILLICRICLIEITPLLVVGTSAFASEPPVCDIKSISAPSLTKTQIQSLIVDTPTPGNEVKMGVGDISLGFLMPVTLWKIQITGCKKRELTDETHLDVKSMSGKIWPLKPEITSNPIPSNSGSDSVSVASFSLDQIDKTLGRLAQISELDFQFTKKETCISHIDFISESVKQTKCIVRLRDKR